MTSRHSYLPSEYAGSPCDQDIRRALTVIVASAAFAKAPRMCHLLRYLVEKSIAGKANEINEYTIGLDVFGRDPRTYDTGTDPLVRVQAGRLRARLKVYYAAATALSGVRISIPLGSYVPLLQGAEPQHAVERTTALALSPLRDIGGNPVFVRGLDEELGSRLFTTLGIAVQLQDSHITSQNGTPGPAHRLEGSIRIEPGHVRASVRLIEADAGRISWLSQFDDRGELDMLLQERLAGAICDGVRSYLTQLAT